MFGVKRTAKNVTSELIRGLNQGSVMIDAPPLDERKTRYSIAVDGLPSERIATIWRALSQSDTKDSSDFLMIYSKVDIVQGNQFRFVDGDPGEMSIRLARVFQAAAHDATIKAHVVV